MKSRSPRTIRIFYTVIAVFVFIITTINFYDVMFVSARTNDMCGWEATESDPDTYVITVVVPGGVTDEAGVQVGDTLVSINGVPVNRSNPQGSIDRQKAGETMTYRLKRGESLYTARVEVVKSPNLPYLALYLLGLGFMLVGWVVLMAKPEGVTQRRFARYGVVALAFFGLSTAYVRIADTHLWDNFLVVVIAITHVFAFVHFISFFCHFPTQKRIAKRRWFIPALYILAILLTGGTILLFYDIPLSARHPAAIWFRVIGWSSPIYMFFVGLGLFAHSYFRRVEKADRRKLRHIVYAVVLGGVAYGYTLFITYTNQLAFLFFPMHAAPAFLLIGVPVAFGYSIIRYRLMDVDLIVRRSLIYGMVTAATAAIYLLFVIGVGNIISGLFGVSENEILTVVAIVAIAFLLDPMKRIAQEWIDKVFYQDRYNYQKALLEFSRELPLNTDIEHILSSMVARISHTMHVEGVAVMLCHEQDGCSDAMLNMEHTRSRLQPVLRGVAAYLKERKTPFSLAIPKEELRTLPFPDDEIAVLQDSGVVLVVPMFYKDELLGIILAGAKLSGKLYSQEDIDLLSTVASQAAIAIENARLLRAEVERQKMMEELNIARRIQLGLLPHEDPDIPGLDISGISIPAQSVGGDYFDYIYLDNNRLLVVVGDVSGKGIPAALYMSKVQGMIRMAAGIYRTPREMLIHVNTFIHERLERNAFITIALALIDMEAGTLSLCRAGHTRPLLHDKERIRYVNPLGMGLGLEEGSVFNQTLEETSYPLEPGMVVVLYSDGLTESMDAAMEEFGEERLLATYTANATLGATALRDCLIDEARFFAGAEPQYDDLTLVVVRMLGDEIPAS